MPVPPSELPILEALVNLRNRLTALKKDRTEYIRAHDVMAIYGQVIEQVDKLNAVRNPEEGENKPEVSPSSTIGVEGEDDVTPHSTPKTHTAQTSAPLPPLSLPGAALSAVDPSSSSSSSPLASSSKSLSPAMESLVISPHSPSSQPHNLAPNGSVSIAESKSHPASPLLQPKAETEEPIVKYTSVKEKDALDGQEVEESKDKKPKKTLNRVDTTLNDVFQLLSLFFLTIGKSRESPAIYCQLMTMKRLLDHLNESGIYTSSDLQPFVARVKEFKEMIRRDRRDKLHPEGLIRLLTHKLDICDEELKSLLDSLSVLDVELVPLHQRLIQIRRKLAAIAAKLRPAKSEIEGLWAELKEIDSQRIDGKFMNPDSSTIPDGQAILAGLLEENFEICQDISARQEDVAPPLQPIYDRLQDLRAQLERLVLTHRWTLRETDLFNFQVSLSEIDGMRVDGKFVDSEGNKPEGQLVLLYLLRRCYGLCYRLVSSSEPVSEELMPINNKLSTVKRCLIEVAKYGGVSSLRELYPYQMALSQIDDLRVDGKFLGRDGSVPEGQAILTAELGECYEIISMLREELEAEERKEEMESKEEENEE
ncbi:hypothetical protein BT69DRAFT_1242315 [Atractiella rhizophila]|nr:hypothetical protein BT69DRAFT_1242315 [Atractiella rhizophila]